MKLLIVQIALFSLATCASVALDKQWDDFKLEFKREYKGIVHELRKKSIFKSNLAIIESHNDLYDRGLSTYKLGINQFADMTFEEFESTVLMRTQTNEDDANILKALKTKTSTAPDAKDWRDDGILNPVKDQGNCGSCWAFAAVGSVEAAWARSTNTLHSLSEQELVDCGAGDCNGGWVDRAYDTMLAKGGEMSEADYPYTAHNGLTCKYDASKMKAKISDYTRVYANMNTIDTNAESLYEYGPHAIYIYANTRFQLYSSGIFDDPTCSTTSYNHAVVAVGYDKSAGYWTIRNSWNSGWGEDGHIRIVMGKNTCNAEHYWWYATV